MPLPVPTDEQNAIIKAFTEAPVGSMIRVQACAGSGKSTTLGHVLSWIADQGNTRTLVTGFANTTINNLKKDLQAAIEFKEYGTGPGIFTSTFYKIGAALSGKLVISESAASDAAREALKHHRQDGESMCGKLYVMGNCAFLHHWMEPIWSLIVILLLLILHYIWLSQFKNTLTHPHTHPHTHPPTHTHTHTHTHTRTHTHTHTHTHFYTYKCECISVSVLNLNRNKM